MNLFRLIADFLHLASFVIIIYKLHKHKNCSGVSAKTQEIYLLVFLTRYLDLFMYFISYYNTIMKILFISVTLYILFLMRLKIPIKNTYDRQKEDIFPHLILIPIALVLSLIVHSGWDWWELIWSFSLWLEALAILPQITIVLENKKVEEFTFLYIITLGSYRFFYILNWIYRYYFEGYLCWTSILSGVVQVLSYSDLYMQYLKR